MLRFPKFPIFRQLCRHRILILGVKAGKRKREGEIPRSTLEQEKAKNPSEEATTRMVSPMQCV